ncbi:alpha/beta hydrolase [Corallococcus macrosporus]|uniref:Esterase n=1 Tax=Corallococcus macrosporus DSM 14697 TaxID=1189310 RepID=A0A250K4D5_9BACT|nr:alpha/beta hydrolase-fold protein [Corallococcus macrosporus]ATB50186.1 esterase [Corallococcus macrosporus DSM 14697]
MRTLMKCMGLLLLVLGCACASTRPAVLEPVPPHQTFTLESAKLKETRHITVYLPPGYAATPEARFPVLYMPDGGLKEDFPHLATTVDAAIRAGELRPLIIVGIENTVRRRDMTGPTTVASDREVAPVIGGSAEFRAFIHEELMPEVERRYRVTRERAIIGESLAGYFIVETFFLQPELFDTYLALSPSLWWNAESLVKEAGERLAARPDLRAGLYVSSADETDIVPAVARLGEVLRASAPPGLKWEVEPRPDLRHDNIYRKSSPGVLRKWLPPVKTAEGSH